MKNVLVKLITIIIMIFIVSGCTTEYKKLAYTTYNEYFQNKEGFIMIDQSEDSEIEIIREIEAGNGTIQIIYLEFKTEDDAKVYIDSRFSKDDKYKRKTLDNYTEIKNTKGKYFKLYKVDNVIVYGVSKDKKDRHKINKILKDLGY